MRRSHQPPARPVEQLHIDHGSNGEPPRPHPSSTQQGTSYLWNGTFQKLIPVLPEDHPQYRENRELITATIRRWDQGKP